MTHHRASSNESGRRREAYRDPVPSWLLHGYIRILLDGAAAAIAMFVAYALRFDFQISPTMQTSMWTWLCAVAVMRPVSLYVTGDGYRTTWRFFDIRDGLVLAFRSLTVTVLLLLVRWCVPGVPIVPYSILILDLSIFLIMASGLRISRQFAYESGYHPPQRPRAIIVGCETTLASAVHHLHSSKEAEIIGLLSEDERLVGVHIAGIPVLGTPESLPSHLVSHHVEIVVLSGANLKCAANVIREASNLDAQVRILPSGSELIDGTVRVNRPISVDQLLRCERELTLEAHPEVLGCFEGRTVFITGAGGSIGSETARQVSGLKVRRVVLFDRDENSLVELLDELEHETDTDTVPIVGDIRDHGAVYQAFEAHRPHIVLHAAAYKHVPMMERNCCEAVLNNIVGTRELASAAVDFESERFVMISTDKAVTPSSVMGATKRAAELLIQKLADDSLACARRTHFACVRFGNVLGSRGSVVPIFLRQIAAGGPITITHEEMTRYFMTIPQSVRLVLQAATLASQGDVYLLDMGDPIKIVNFADEIIRLAGLTPGKDIAIKVVGVRPGERLHERLWAQDAIVTATRFPDVFQVKATGVLAEFNQQLAKLEDAAVARKSDTAIQDLLLRLPIDYCPGRTETIPISAAD